MAARQRWTWPVEQEQQDRLEEKRARDRDAARRYRARQRADADAEPAVMHNRADVHTGALTRQRHLHPLPWGPTRRGDVDGGADVSHFLYLSSSSSSSSSSREESDDDDGEENARIGAILAPYRARGYVHQPRLWDVLRELYPRLPLELEAFKIAGWLDESANAGRRCTVAFLHNWLKTAEADRRAWETRRSETPAETVPAAKAAPVPPPGPPVPALPDRLPAEGLRPVDRGDWERFKRERRGQSLQKPEQAAREVAG